MAGLIADGRAPAASRSWRSARSSVAWRSRARPTGCSSRSATNRAPGEWPGSTRCRHGLRARHASTPRSSPRSPPSASGPSSPTRSWPMTPAGPDSRATSSSSRSRPVPDTPTRCGSRRSSRSARSRAPRRGSAGRSTRRSGRTSSRASWHGPCVAALAVDRPRRRARRQPRSRGPRPRAAELGRPDPPPAHPRPQRGPRRGTGRRRRRRRGGDPRPPDRPAVRHSRGRARRSSSRPSTCARRPRTVVLVTDRHGTGTNALGLRPPDVIDFAFGPGSRARPPSRRRGRRRRPTSRSMARSTVDLDTPDDLVFVEVDAERGAPRCRLTRRSASSRSTASPRSASATTSATFIGNAIERTRRRAAADARRRPRRHPEDRVEGRGRRRRPDRRRPAARGGRVRHEATTATRARSRSCSARRGASSGWRTACSSPRRAHGFVCANGGDRCLERRARLRVARDAPAASIPMRRPAAIRARDPRPLRRRRARHHVRLVRPALALGHRRRRDRRVRAAAARGPARSRPTPTAGS